MFSDNRSSALILLLLACVACSDTLSIDRGPVELMSLRISSGTVRPGEAIEVTATTAGAVEGFVVHAATSSGSTLQISVSSEQCQRGGAPYRCGQVVLVTTSVESRQTVADWASSEPWIIAAEGRVLRTGLYAPIVILTFKDSDASAHFNRLTEHAEVEAAGFNWIDYVPSSGGTSGESSWGVLRTTPTLGVPSELAVLAGDTIEIKYAQPNGEMLVARAVVE